MKKTTCFAETEIPSEFTNQAIKKKRPSDSDKRKTKFSGLDVPDQTGEKFARLEKDLFTIGFFSAPKYRHAKRNPKQEKIVKLTSIGKTGIETSAEILTHARYVLPTTSDLTKYLAFLKIIDERYKTGGIISNPIQFTHYELLQKAGIERNQDRYEEVTTWLERLDNTQIIIHGETADNGAEEKRLYKLFSEVRLSGRTNQDGEKIKFNTVWLSEWAIKNICKKPMLPVDFETYQKLKNNVAKLLVVHLQTWLYASRRQAYFEKSYLRFCELLGLKQQKSRSEIIRQIAPALNELKKYEYISDWELVSGMGGLKIKIRHGAKFQRDRHKCVGFTGEPENLKPEPNFNCEVEIAAEPFDEEKAQMLVRLTGLGIYRDLAKSLIEKFPLKKLEVRIAWALKDLHFKEQKEKVRKPGGLLYKIINSDDEPGLLNSETYDRPYFETDHQPFEVLDDINESFADKEFEKSKWLRTQFETFCLTEALKNPRLDFQLFSSGFDAGQNLFNGFLGEMQKRLGKQIYQCWFETLSFAGHSGNLFYVAGGEINRDWVMTYYEQTVKDVFQKINLPDLRLEWIISDSIPPDAGLEYYYSQHLVKGYQDETGITLEEFYHADQQELDKSFERYFEDSYGKSDISET